MRFVPYEYNKKRHWGRRGKAKGEWESQSGERERKARWWRKQANDLAYWQACLIISRAHRMVSFVFLLTYRRLLTSFRNWLTHSAFRYGLAPVPITSAMSLEKSVNHDFSRLTFFLPKQAHQSTVQIVIGRNQRHGADELDNVLHVVLEHHD